MKPSFTESTEYKFLVKVIFHTIAIIVIFAAITYGEVALDIIEHNGASILESHAYDEPQKFASPAHRMQYEDDIAIANKVAPEVYLLDDKGQVVTRTNLDAIKAYIRYMRCVIKMRIVGDKFGEFTCQSLKNQ